MCKSPLPPPQVTFITPMYWTLSVDSFLLLFSPPSPAVTFTT